MHDEAQDKDKYLADYFDAKQREAIPKKITEGYTQGVLQRLQAGPSSWSLAALLVLGFALGAVFVVTLWQPWKKPILVTQVTQVAQAPSIPAIELDATILDQVSPGDLPPLPIEDLLPQVEMLDSFTVAMQSNGDHNSLSIEEEMQVLTAVGADTGTSPDTTEQELDLLDSLETT